MVKTVITILDLSKTYGPDCIPVVVLKNNQSELSYILARQLNMSLKISCFPDCWKVLSVVPVFKDSGKRCTAKNYRPVSLLSVVSSKIFEKLVNNRIVDHLEKCGLFFWLTIWFQVLSINCRFRWSTVWSHISESYDNVCHASLLHKLKVGLSAF